MRTRRLALIVLLLLVTLPWTPSVFAEEDPKPAPGEPKTEPADPKPAPDEPDPKERARLKELVAELRQVTADIRGLEWKQPVEADLMTRDQMVAYMQKQVKEDMKPEELERDQRILRRMGYITAEEDMLEIVIEMFAGMAGGFFNPKTKKLYLLAGTDPESMRPTIIHELLHALEDQYYDLENTDKRFKDDPDGLFAFKCLIEGSAEMARFLYEEKHPEEGEKEMAGQGGNPEDAKRQQAVLKNTPLFMLYSTLLHYKTGPIYVRNALAGRSYTKHMNELMKPENAPTTQEQVLHPERFLGEKKDLPQTITWAGDLAETLGEGWTKLQEMSYGELDLALWLDSQLASDGGRLQPMHTMTGNVTQETAREAAMGWDGGRLLFLTDKEDNLVFGSAMVFDTVKDAKEAYAAMNQALANIHGDDWMDGDIAATIDDSSTTLSYTGSHGAGRLMRRGHAVLLLDGLSDDEMKTAWPVFAKTKFVQDENDTNVMPDPFEGCEIVDRKRGTGWDLPEDWADNENARRMMSRASPFFLGIVERKYTNEEGTEQVMRVTAEARDFRLNVPRLPVIMKQIMQGRPVPKEALTKVSVGELDGYRIDLHQAGSPNARRLYVMTNTQRLFIVRVEGPTALIEGKQADIEELFAGIRVRLSY